MPEEKDLAAPARIDNRNTTPAPTDRYGARYGGYNNSPPPMESDLGDGSVSMSHYVWILKRQWPRIAIFVLTSVIATAIICSRLTPVYESTAILDVDRQAPANVVGQEESQLRSNFDSDQFMATQMKLIDSDSVTRPVAQQLHLPPSEIGAVAGDARSEEAPINLKHLKVTRPPNTYLIYIIFRSANPRLAAQVANAIAHRYIERTYEIRFNATAELSNYMEKQLEELRAKMEKSSGALAQFEKEMNVIDPEQKTSILSSRLLQLNTEYTSAEGDRVRKEAAFRQVQSGSLEAAEASDQGEQLRRLSERMNEADEKLATVKLQYGAAHPEYKRAASQFNELQRQMEALKTNIVQRVSTEFDEAKGREALLKQAVVDTKAEFDALNARSFEYKALKQEAESNKGLYDQLIRKIKEAGINSSFQNSSIRLADPARPVFHPVFPDKTLSCWLALLFSLTIGAAGAIASDLMDHSVRDPEQIQRTLDTPVIGALPLVMSWRTKILRLSARATSDRALQHHVRREDLAYTEAVRTLRDSILLSDMHQQPRSLLITSAVPREGKSNTALHLAIAHSTQRAKTLLIDGDLRRPTIHDRVGISNQAGLSEVITDGANWRDLVQQPAGYPGLSVLPAGRASRAAADRIGGALQKIFKTAYEEYELIIIDAPPLLGFAEPLQIAKQVDAVVIIAVAGRTDRKALASVIVSLRRLKANVLGLILNEVQKDMSDRYYYYGYYGKYYSKYYTPTKT
jgi:capsular exopolysaccharide synthesis family protein